MGQTDSTATEREELELIFIKEIVEQSPDSLYFNILRIENNTEKSISGTLRITLPDGFRLISFSNMKYSVNPDSSIAIPIRVSIPYKALGGQTYVVNSLFSYDENNVNKSCYIKIPEKRKWRMETEQSDIYLNNIRSSSELIVNLFNDGNTEELVKLDFEVGKLLNIPSLTGLEKTRYIKLAASYDTSITYTVNYANNLRADEKNRLEQIWIESQVSIKGSNEKYSKTGRHYFKMLENNYNGDTFRKSPFGLELQSINLMSDAPARFNISSFGTVLLNNEQEVEYFFSGRHFQLNPFSEQDLSFARNTYFYARYTGDNFDLYLGDNIRGSQISGGFGRGMNAKYFIGKNTLGLSASTSKFTRDYSGSFSYSREISNNLRLNTTIAAENNISYNNKNYTWMIGGDYSFLKHHYVSAGIAGSIAAFENYLPDSLNASNDTSLFGISWLARYRMNYERFKLSVTNLNTLHNYNRVSGQERWNINGSYTLDEKSSLVLRFDRYKHLQTRLPQRLLFTPSNNSNNIGRIYYTRAIGNNLYFMGGPVLMSQARTISDQSREIADRFSTNDFSLYGSLRFKISDLSSVTPFFYLGYVMADYKPGTPGLEEIKIRNKTSFKSGLNIYSPVWRVSAYYSRHASVNSYLDLLYEGDDVVNSSIQFRPYYENFFFDNKLKISAYLNYIYTLPSKREIRNLNTTAYMFLNDGWSVYASNNIYSTSRSDEEVGRVSNMSVNLFLGIRKTFQFQQPRQKFYNIKFNIFHDKNGNKLRDPDEAPIHDMMLTIKQATYENGRGGAFGETQLVSDLEGRILLEDIPEGDYNLTFFPLAQLKDIYLMNGMEQTITVSGNQEFNIPLVESYKVKGIVKLLRDENSREGNIDLEGIRIAALADNGETYTTLSDNHGTYLLSIPRAGVYKIKIYNVLGQNYTIEQDEFEVNLEVSKNINIDFTFIEKKRAVNIQGGGYNFKSLNKKKN